jgi:hypothetical protein
MSFADIAAEFGVTRERVRQWQTEFFPDAPHGRERRRLCHRRQERRRLLSDPLFSAFYRHARAHLGVDGVQLIDGASGFRTRTVRVRGRFVALRRASSDVADRRVPRFRGRADYVYFLLPCGDFVLAPARPRSCGDSAAVRNSFAIFAEPAAPQTRVEEAVS